MMKLEEKRVSVEVQLTGEHWWANDDGTLWFWSSLGQTEPPAELLDHPASPTALPTIFGEWAVVDLRGDIPTIIADPLRSRPLFFARIGGVASQGNWLISDQIESFRTQSGWQQDTDQSEVFRHFGYTLGAKTLVEGVGATPAGTIVSLLESKPAMQTYLDYRFKADRIAEKEVFAEVMTAALDASFGRLLARAGDSQLVVPLSGGLDSRLILSWLRRCGASNVLTFSYGVASEGTIGGEGAEARRVAEQLGYPIRFVEIDPERVADRWNGPEGDEFRRAVWRGTSLPHIQDWEALRQLTQSGALEAGAIVLPGHTIVGNMHDQHLLRTGEPGQAVTVSDVARAIVHEHGRQAGHPEQAERLPAFRESVRAALAAVAYDGSVDSIQAMVEWYNLQERQAKYINNSMAGYEHFGLRWSLPMLDREMWDAWLSGSTELTATRDWYAEFVEETFVAQGGEVTSLYDPRPSLIKKYVKSGPVQLVARSPLGPVLDHIRIAFVDREHPLGLQAFDPYRHPWERFLAKSRGLTRSGEWSQAFLDNAWGGSGPVPQ